MITAKEARELIPDMNAIIKKELEYANRTIADAAKDGKNEVGLVFPNKTIQHAIANTLRSLNYDIVENQEKYFDVLTVKW